MNCRYLFLLLFIITFNLFAQKDNLNVKLDSILVLRNLSKDRSLGFEKRLDYAKKASQLSKETKVDTTILKSNRNLSFFFLNMGKYDFVKTINLQNLLLSRKLNDSTAKASANYYLGICYEIELQSDSAYYYYSEANKLYNKLNNVQSESEVLLNMANIQFAEKDYIGAEVNAIRSLKLIQTLPKTQNNLDTFWSLYNLLGNVFEKLKQFDKSIEYHNKALPFINRISDNYLNNLFSNTNLGIVYREKGDYKKSIEYFEKILEDKTLLGKQPSDYANTINEIAYTRFLSKDPDIVGIDAMFKRAYKVADSINDPIMVMSSSSNLGEFYLSINKKDSALFYTEKAFSISKEIKFFDLVSKSLLLLSKIKEGDEGKKYLYAHIKLNDSLLNNERNIRNKFARTEFETDQIEAENVTLSRQRLIFLISSIGLLLTLVLLYIIISQRAKNRKLEFVQQQQEANEEIYNLMLAQQDKIDEGRTEEKKRISQELHDGILGSLFGTRISLDSLNMIQTEDAIKSREGYINELKTIEDEIRKISHDLNADFITGSGFIDIIKTLIETQTQAYKLTYIFNQDYEIYWDEVSNKTKIHVYRMLQETMQNIYKHAKAKQIKISFELKNNVILLIVEDDGYGFNVAKAKKGIGIKNINARVKEIRGNVEINSKIDIGTTVKIEIPYN